jgi:predicted NBD/HSP70 family sugar kinase
MPREPGIAAHPLGPGTLLQLIRDADGTTRADLSGLTGLARSTISQRLDQLRAQGLLRELGESDSTGGRPPMMLAFNEDAGVVLAADLGATHSRLAITNLGGTVLAEDSGDMAISAGPEVVLDWADERFHRLLRDVGHEDGDVRGIGIGVPGPVEHATGRPRNPPIMPGWDGYPIPERFADRYRVPVLVDNDVNIMALGEHWTNWREVDHLLFVKVATGIGCGIVVDGRIHRGAEGAAGDIGHIRVAAEGAEAITCSCGNVGCLEALAGGAAMARQLSDRGLEAADSRAVVELARAGESAAVQLVRDSGRLIGEVLAASVNLYNPSVIVIGGDVAQAHEQLLAGVREVVYQRSLPLATRHLRVVRSQLADRAGVIGAAVMVVERILSPAAIDAAIASAPPGERAAA